MVEIDAELSKR